MQRRRLALALITLISLLAGAYGAQIPIKGDMEALLPPDTPLLLHAKATREALGPRNELTIIVGGEARETNLEVARALAAGLESLEEIERVEFERDTALLENNALLFLETEALRELQAQVEGVISRAVERELALDPLDEEAKEGEERAEALPSKEDLLERHQLSALGRYQESPDGGVIALSAFPRFKPEDIQRSRAMMQQVEGLMSALCPTRSVECVAEGDYSGVSRSVDELSSALKTSSLIALFGVIALLGLAFRRLRALVLVVIPLACALAWTLGLAHLLVGELNLISAFIFAILIGLGVDFGVHALSRVDEAREASESLGHALVTGLGSLGRAMRVAAMTTIATFLSLVFFDFRGFSHFGAIAAAGIALSLVAVYALLPALSLTLDKEGPAAPEAPDAPSERQGGPRWAWATLGLLSLVTLWSIAGLDALRFEGDMRVMRIGAAKEHSGLKRAYREEVAGRAPSPAVVITSGGAETKRLTRHLEGLKEREERLEAVASIYSFIPEAQEEKRAIIAELHRRITQKLGALSGEDQRAAEALLPYLSPSGLEVDALPQWVKARFLDATGEVDRVVYLFARGVKSRAEEVLEIQEAIGSVSLDGVTYRSAAPWMFSGEAFETVKREGPLAIALAALVVLLLLLVDLRSASAALRAYLPLVMGIIISLGVATRVGLSLNLFNIIVLPVIFGIGVDTAVHLVYRRREGASVAVTLKRTGRAAALSALTSAVGFASLLSVPSEGLQSIGWLGLIGIVVTTMTTILGVSAMEALAPEPEA